MLPYGTEVRPVPRFAVDQEATAATTHPRLVGLHDDDEEEEEEEEEEVLFCSEPDLPPY